MKKVGIYGGSFDPIHIGHLITAQSVFEIRKLEKIIFIPSYISPFKKGMASSSPNYRLNMLKLAIKGIPYFEYSDFELKSKGISYTINTIRELSKIYNDMELIIGYDNLLTFDRWKEPNSILEFAKLVVLKRTIKQTNAKPNKYFQRAVFVDTPLIEIRGTDIRQRVKKNMSINFLVPQKVMAYIYKYNLYKEKSL